MFSRAGGVTCLRHTTAWQAPFAIILYSEVVTAPRERSPFALNGKLPIKVFVCPNPKTKANRRRYERPQPDIPALYELTKRAGRTSGVPDVERDGRDFHGIFDRPYALLPESAPVRLDRIARIQPCDARSRGRRKVTLGQFWESIWVTAKVCLCFVK